MQLLHTHKHMWTVTTSLVSEQKDMMHCIIFNVVLVSATSKLITTATNEHFPPLSHLLVSSLLYVSWLLPLFKFLILKYKTNLTGLQSYNVHVQLALPVLSTDVFLTEKRRGRMLLHSNLANKSSMNYLSLWATKVSYHFFCNIIL